MPCGSTGAGALNEGRDVNPGDTHMRSRRHCGRSHAQRRPGRESRRHTTVRASAWRSWPSLNEGRDVNPGDTSTTQVRPRRRRSPLNEGRDVNPGDTQDASAPGDTSSTRCSPKTPWHAQRRPGRESRRHGGRAAASHGVDHAQRRPRVRSALNEGRDVNPGDTRRSPGTQRPAAPLNEGRDVNPGDTRAARDVRRDVHGRSTKAGT